MTRSSGKSLWRPSPLKMHCSTWRG